jgi:hypothetical protein
MSVMPIHIQIHRYAGRLQYLWTWCLLTQLAHQNLNLVQLQGGEIPDSQPNDNALFYSEINSCTVLPRN